MTSITKLRKQLASERKKLSKEQERKDLNRELFELKHRRSIKVVKTIGKGGARVGRGLGKMVQAGYSMAKDAEKKAKKKKKGSGSGFGGGFDTPDVSKMKWY